MSRSMASGEGSMSASLSYFGRTINKYLMHHAERRRRAGTEVY
jgi:hypothetical protein